MSIRFARLAVLAFLILPLPVIASAAAGAKPDWAQRMAGRWQGEGARIEISTGAQTLVEVGVVSEWHPELPLPALVSKNHFKETVLDVDGNPVSSRQYDRIYWVRENSRQGARAELLLGSGTDSSGPIASRGSYDLQSFIMIVQQDLGSGTRIHSQSDMSNPGMTVYNEMIWLNGRKKTQSEIRYQLQTP